MFRAIPRISFHLALFILLPSSLVTVAVAQGAPLLPLAIWLPTFQAAAFVLAYVKALHTGAGDGTFSSPVGGYGNDQGCPLTLFQ